MFQLIHRAVVRHFGSPRVVGAWLQENVGTADVPVDDRVWSHEVEVVQNSCHVQADGGDLMERDGSLLQHCSEAGGQELSQDDYLTLQGGPHKLDEVWVTNARSHIHLPSEKPLLMLCDDLLIEALCGNTSTSEHCHFDGSPPPPPRHQYRLAAPPTGLPPAGDVHLSP